MKTSKIFIENLETITKDNGYYRKVIYTVPNEMQLVLMSLPPDIEIGMEMHSHITQFIRVESGEGELRQQLDGISHPLTSDSTVMIPKGVYHNIINTGKQDLKLYTIYTPPNHPSDKVEIWKTEEM